MILSIGFNSNTALFADDTFLYKVLNQPISAGIELNTDLTNITKWALEWLVNFQPLKTNSLIKSRKRNKPDHPILAMNQTQIDEVKQHKHLGIDLSDDLTWTSHIETISSKAWKRIGLLRRYKYLLDRASLQKNVYFFIRPLLEYGDIIWDNSSAANKRALENIYIEALRITTGETKVCCIQKLYDDSKWETL